MPRAEPLLVTLYDAENAVLERFTFGSRASDPASATEGLQRKLDSALARWPTRCTKATSCNGAKRLSLETEIWSKK